MSDALIAAWRRVADRQDGPPSLRIDRSAPLGLVEAAEQLRDERDEARAVAHNPTIAAPVPAVAPPTAGTHPDSPETSESRTAPLPPPVVPRCDGCRWWRGHGSAENPRWVIRTVKGIDRDALLTLAPGITVIEQRCTLCGRTDIDHTPGKVSLAEKETP